MTHPVTKGNGRLVIRNLPARFLSTGGFPRHVADFVEGLAVAHGARREAAAFLVLWIGWVHGWGWPRMVDEYSALDRYAPDAQPLLVGDDNR